MHMKVLWQPDQETTITKAGEDFFSGLSIYLKRTALLSLAQKLPFVFNMLVVGSSIVCHPCLICEVEEIF